MNEEKKVEYLELIYDLIFVYLIGRNNSLIHHVENGFISAGVYATYLLCTLIALFIWYQTTLFINRYGTNGRLEHIGIFINMYLLYYMAEGTRVNWQGYYLRYNMAWGLIFLNLAFMYYRKLREISQNAPWEAVHIKNIIRVMLIMGGIVFLSIPIYHTTGIAFSPVVLLYGLVDVIRNRHVNNLVAVDFSHLSERAMLFVVFTFGEMIVGLALYFEGEVNFWGIYYSAMVFALVVGLFLSYEFFYDHIIDREGSWNANLYMMIHIFLIVALNNITVGLEFMREEEVDFLPKNVMLVAAILAYFFFLFLLEEFAKKKDRANRTFIVGLIFLALLFVAVIAASYKILTVSIAVTVAFVYAVFGLIYRFFQEIHKD